MSRTKKTGGSKSPVTKYMSFSGGKGKIKFYDKNHKDADDKGNVYLDSLHFAVVDIRASISGYNEKTSSQVRSNMLDPFETGKQPFVIKTKSDGKFQDVLTGIWKDIKAEAEQFGGKFTSNIFAVADVGEGIELVRLELNGSSLTPWIEYIDGLGDSEKVYDRFITITKGQLCTRKKGKTLPVSDTEYKKVIAELKKDPMADKPVWFYTPAFTDEDLEEEVVEFAIEQDELLQAYFEGMGDGKSKDVDDTDVDEHADTVGVRTSPKAPPVPVMVEDDDDQDLPF